MRQVKTNALYSRSFQERWRTNLEPNYRLVVTFPINLTANLHLPKVEIGINMTTNSPELHSAAFEGDLAKVRELIEAGANPNSTGDCGSGTLLNFHPKVTSYLLANGAPPDTQTNENGASVLAGLCYVNQIQCVKLLLEHGANPDLGHRDTLETPMHHAIANDASAELIALLIAHNANVNTKTKPGIYSYNYYGDTPTRGETALHRASAYAPIETVKLLLDAGADRNTTDINGNTPYQWAGWHRREKDLVQLLASA